MMPQVYPPGVIYVSVHLAGRFAPTLDLFAVQELPEQEEIIEILS